MGNAPLTYIVILNFNAADQTIECVESVKKIQYPNYKVVIVDNDSADQSYEVLKEKYKEYEVLQSGENLGYAKGNNIGIQYALEQGAQYVCILNNDVVVEPDFLTLLVRYGEEHKNVGILGPCICDYYEKDKIQAMGANINLYTGLAQAKYKNQNYNNLQVDYLEVDYLGGACFIAKAEVFEKIGYIPENYFLFFEETEFCLKAKRAGFHLIGIVKSKIYHKGSATISKFKGLSYFYLNRNRIIFIRRNANLFQKCIFPLYLFIETVGRMLIRKEGSLFRYYREGYRADLNQIDLKKINELVKK